MVTMIESITVDGVDVTENCIEFDNDEGWAIVLKTTPSGKFVLSEDRTQFVRERLTGKVVVTMKASKSKEQ